MSGMSGQLSNMALVLGLVQLAKHLDLEAPERIGYIRLGFAVANLCIFAMCLYLRRVIQQTNDQTPLKYNEPAGLGNPEPKVVETTNRDYDLQEVKKQINSTLMTMALLGFLHYKWGFVQPLFLQSILPLKTFFTSNLVQVHAYKQAAVDRLQRPWRPENPFEKLAAGNARVTDAVPPAADQSSSEASTVPDSSNYDSESGSESDASSAPPSPQPETKKTQ
ncbi:phosphate transporter (Pho88) [Dimargaris xerosporica]|nr:phosphate transporter (Pho88) [Dimargaris xerosporica]